MCVSTVQNCETDDCVRSTTVSIHYVLNIACCTYYLFKLTVCMSQTIHKTSRFYETPSSGCVSVYTGVSGSAVHPILLGDPSLHTSGSGCVDSVISPFLLTSNSSLCT